MSNSYAIYGGDCLEHLKAIADNSVDSLVTDPPAGISFMGKEWDHHKGGRAEWVAWMAEVMRECLRVMKPGAHGLVWALPRTSHWTATALEDAGFEVRDCIYHIFGQGFPKSLDISKAIDKAAGAEREVVSTIKKTPSAAKCHEGWERPWAEGKTTMDITAPATDAAKQWSGWGTALKPACEEWVLVRKPCSEKTVAANVLKWGTGGLNIDGCRIGTEVRTVDPTGTRIDQCSGRDPETFRVWQEKQQPKQVIGRFPSHLVFSHSPYCTDEQCDVECAIAQLDAQSGSSTSPKSTKAKNTTKAETVHAYGKYSSEGRVIQGHGDSGGASRFFYTAKISSSERGDSTHPTMKTQKLMRYLCRMVTPPGGLILDPFTGSGSTGLAAISEGFRFIGIEREAEYVAIAEKRMEAACAVSAG